METLHYMDEPTMFLVNVGAGDGKTIHYIDITTMFSVDVGAGDGKITLQ